MMTQIIMGPAHPSPAMSWGPISVMRGWYKKAAGRYRGKRLPSHPSGMASVSRYPVLPGLNSEWCIGNSNMVEVHFGPGYPPALVPILLTPYIRAAIRIRSVRRSVVFLSWKRVAARAVHKEECHHTDEGQKSNLYSHAQSPFGVTHSSNHTLELHHCYRIGAAIRS